MVRLARRKKTIKLLKLFIEKLVDLLYVFFSQLCGKIVKPYKIFVGKMKNNRDIMCALLYSLLSCPNIEKGQHTRECLKRINENKKVIKKFNDLFGNAVGL